MNLFRLRVVLLASAVLLVGCDHYTKQVAKVGLERSAPHTLVAGVLDLDYTENTDSGFGLLRKVPVSIRTPILTAAQMTGGAVMLLLCLRRKSRRGVRLALLLLSAGALANGIDRLARGYVVDFIHIHHWPVFNLADVYITAGALLLFLGVRLASSVAPPASPSSL